MYVQIKYSFLDITTMTSNSTDIWIYMYVRLLFIFIKFYSRIIIQEPMYELVNEWQKNVSKRREKERQLTIVCACAMWWRVTYARASTSCIYASIHSHTSSSLYPHNATLLVIQLFNNGAKTFCLLFFVIIITLNTDPLLVANRESEFTTSKYYTS